MSTWLRTVTVCVILSVLCSGYLPASETPPKREFRASWIATVFNIDWPSSGSSPANQRNQLISILDNLKAAGLNAVVLQMRTECDALYDSPLEPWSYWLTGQQGAPPSPYYDPLAFAVGEAHKRGIELHAWLNPYRAMTSGSYTRHPSHVTNAHPDWILNVGGTQILNPGIPEVRGHILNVIEDIITRYDIDGIHMDDYFYPYPPNQITTQDAQTFADHNRGIANIHDWRRDNINLLLREIQALIGDTKPHVKFGMSPFGIWKSGVPIGISGLDAYSTIYCDAIAWLQDQSIDYLTPQLYWPHGGGQDYAKLMPWWADSALHYERHLYAGHAAYRITGWTNTEMPNQLRLNRSADGCQGSVFYNTNTLLSNPRGFLDSLKTNLYLYPALPPVMEWKNLTPPNIPREFRFERLASRPVAALVWEEPIPSSATSDVSRYVVYRIPGMVADPGDIDDPRNIMDIIGETEYIPRSGSSTGSVYFVVTALDRNSNESVGTSVVEVQAPEIPLLALPQDGDLQGDEVILVWQYAEHAGQYDLQVSTESSFASGVIVDETGLQDTSYTIANLTGQQVYYWRTRAHNVAGSSAFSEVRSFTTATPLAPVLAGPEHASTDIPLNPMLTWYSEISASAYRFQLLSSRTITESTILIDSTGIVDTSVTLHELSPNTIYYWRVNANNDLGSGEWSEIWGFRTIGTTLAEQERTHPERYLLSQNYPNPFNPSTTIEFSVPSSGNVTIRIYDLLGRLVRIIVDDYVEAGRYSVTFDAGQLPSGAYIYQMRTADFIDTKRMLLLK